MKNKINLVDWAASVQPDTTKHQLYVLDALERVANRDRNRLMISMPPGHGKTHSVLLLAAYMLSHSPQTSILHIVAREELANHRSRTVSYMVGRGSVLPYTAVGIDNLSAHHNADLIIIDDPYGNHVDAENPRIRDRVLQQYRDLENHNPDSRVVLLTSRSHSRDLMGQLIESESSNWEIINLPAICESEGDPLGRAIGDPLWPEYISLESLARRKADIGPLVWSTMFQGQPQIDPFI